MLTPLEFETPIYELESKLEALRMLSDPTAVNMGEEIAKLQEKVNKQLKATYSKLSPWQKVLVARHPNRPKFYDYIKGLIEDFVELCGDRAFAEDKALIGGIGRFKGQTVVVMGQYKGDDTESRIKHNFGMPKPEGYRKARRLMMLAQQFNLPILAFVDTAGAYPGIDAEERGQAEAIAKCLEESARLEIPTLSVITGEGGSGGAIAIAMTNKVFMLEHSVYSVISPEGCASILWRTADKKEDAAKAQKLTAQDLLALKVIDGIIEEPLGGAHRSPSQTVAMVGRQLEEALRDLKALSPTQLKQHRRERFLKIGQLKN